jgi:hypothetical protein
LLNHRDPDKKKQSPSKLINSERILDPEIPHALRLQAILVGERKIVSGC